MKTTKYPVYNISTGEMLGIFVQFNYKYITSAADAIMIKMGSNLNVRCELLSIYPPLKRCANNPVILSLDLDDYSENQQI